MTKSEKEEFKKIVEYLTYEVNSLTSANLVHRKPALIGALNFLDEMLDSQHECSIRMLLIKAKQKLFKNK